jgi:hypothetical protein
MSRQSGAAQTVGVVSIGKRNRHELRHLEETADRGESEETPWILLGGVWLFWTVVFLVVLVLALLAYSLAS